MHHHMCASENKWLKWISDDKIEGRKCFDCWLLEASLKGTVHALQLQPYYKQLTDWSRVSISPFSIGVSVAAFQLLPSFNPRPRLWPAELRVPIRACVQAILSMSALSLQPVCKTTQRARLASASGKCKKCRQGGELLACCFCTALYHNTEACLPHATLSSDLAASACFPWACPTCFKKGMGVVQRTVLKPTGQRAAGAKKPRKKRRNK